MKQKLHDLFVILASKTEPKIKPATSNKQRENRSMQLYFNALMDVAHYTKKYDVAKLELKFIGYDSKIMRKRTFIIND